uniref:Uncharacterized protein n=1 Tax=Coccolithus braarudii TaxID=221442 RepID=A0A7S0Q5P3_9EUKA|mmetsp:Transcript_3986/g.8646  ORF Transcript_3986/g.8646 Transcript_3986/m.8646 type:complete len:136 (+) Transcript_3986:153-560(+)
MQRFDSYALASREPYSLCRHTCTHPKCQAEMLGAKLRRLGAELQAAEEARAELAQLNKTGADETSKLQAQLATTQQLCIAAKDECTRVRRRNENLERELASLRERVGLMPDGTCGMDGILGNIEHMERMMHSSDR